MSLLCLHLIQNRAAIGTVTHDRAGTTAAMPPGGGPGTGLAPDSGWFAVSGAQAAAKAGAENFPVALRLVPSRPRRHLLAVYNFARTVDDAGDLAPPDQRLRLLGELAADVRRLYAVLPGEGGADDAGTVAGGGATPGAVAAAGPAKGTEAPRLAVVRGLADTVADCQIPMEPFLDLIRANEQDQVVTRYQSFPDLLDYCRLSANPVGRIVLHIFGGYSPQRAQMSDAICTGLQLTEHWQDVGEDMRAGRIYLPTDDLRSYECTEQDLLSPRAAPQLRRLIAFEAGRARALIDEGAPLIGTLRGAARAAVAGYVAGGRAALTALARADYEVLAAAPRPGKGRVAAELIAAFVRAR
jgi:squalene synthase HpnC